MSTPANTIKQRTIDVPVSDGLAIPVRRMYHKAAREFIKKLSEVLATRADLFKRDAEGRMAFFNIEKILPEIPAIIISVDDLAEYLVNASTDSPELVSKLDFPAWAEILAAALKLNCGDELKNSFAGIVEALAPLLADQPMKTSSGAAPTPSSSMPATAPTT